MKSKNFILAAIASVAALFMLNAIAYVVFLGEFFKAHSSLPADKLGYLFKPVSETSFWATALSSIALGVLVTVVIYWSRARTFLTGLRTGIIFGILLLLSVDFGLLATTNMFTTVSAVADITLSALTITLGSGLTAWIVGFAERSTRLTT